VLRELMVGHIACDRLHVKENVFPDVDHLQLNSQVYLTPGFQVLGGYQKLGTLPD